MKMNKKKQRGAAAIEYAILAAAMSIIMFNFLGEEGKLTGAVNSTYESVISKLDTIQGNS